MPGSGLTHDRFAPPLMTWTRVPAIDPAVAIAGSVIFALILFLPPILNDGDTLWQIRTGEWILTHRAIPAVDPFAFTTGGKPWYAHEWLAETLMALAYRAAGMAGVMTLAAAAAGLTAAALLHHLRRFLPGIYAIFGLIVALSNAAPSMLARPHLLAWPCLVLWTGGLIAARANRAPPSFWLLPVMLVWVNLHGSFMFGLLLPCAFLLEALCDPGARFKPVFTRWAAFLAASWTVALLNPDGLGGLMFPFQHLRMESLAWIGEWEPTDFSRIQPLELVILGLMALGLSGKVTLPPMRLLLLLGLIHMALSHARNEQLLGIAGVLILAEPLGASLGRGAAAALTGAWHRAVPVAALFAVTVLGARLTLPLGPDRTQETFAAAMDRVPPALRAKPVLNDYSQGGRLIFQGVRPFIDSRADLYGDAFLARYRQIAAADRDAVAQVLAEYGIAWTIFPVGHRILERLDQTPGWRRLLEADGLVIHARD